MANIGANELGLCAERAELSDKLRTGVAMTAGDDDLVAFVGEGQGRGTADSGERAGNQDDGHLALLRMSLVGTVKNPLGCGSFPGLKDRFFVLSGPT